VAQTITLKEALDYLDGGKPFNIMFITANKDTGEGGEECNLTNCRKLMHKTTTMKVAEKQQESKLAGKVHKNPRHYPNSTRNLVLENGEIRKCHIRLIRQFNGKTIL
jgi:hypothetical protein